MEFFCYSPTRRQLSCLRIYTCILTEDTEASTRREGFTSALKPQSRFLFRSEYRSILAVGSPTACMDWKRLVGRGEDRKGGSRVALFIDGPNILRDEFSVDLDDIRAVARDAGQPTTARLYLDENAPPDLIRAGEARGFEVIVTSGDVDVKLAVDATQFVCNEKADVIAIASRDTDFKPVVEAANAAGFRTLAIAPGAHGRSDALRNAATDSVTLTE